MSDEKMIRFIDSNYNELFKIPDGGSIVVTRPDSEFSPQKPCGENGAEIRTKSVCEFQNAPPLFAGFSGEQYIGICKYLDEMHVEVNNLCYHHAQFAEIQERNGATVKPEKEPEMVGGHYRIINRISVGDKVFVMGHSPKAPQPFATWQAYRDKPGKDMGHYWHNRSDAWSDLLCRADSERTGKYYDHTKKYKQKTRDDRCR